LIDKLAGGRRAEWDIILNMPIKEFLNTLSYHVTMKREQQKRLEKSATSFESYVMAVLNEML